MPARRIPRAQLIRETLLTEIGLMLDELGHPPLVDKIFPRGWRNAKDDELTGFYDLCLRSYPKENML